MFYLQKTIWNQKPIAFITSNELTKVTPYKILYTHFRAEININWANCGSNFALSCE